MVHFGGTSEKCSVCSKTVYLAEKIVVEDKEDKKTYHKTCLKCSHCKATLSLGNYASMNGVMYCKPHFKQLFATKGNYDEGFGKEKLTSKWTPNSGVPASAGSPSGSHAPSFVPVDKEEVKSAEKKETPSAIASRFQKSSSSSEKCETCGKTVYATEKIVIEEKEGKKVYHKACLRCSHCQVVLTLGNYASMGGVTYCKPHLKQLFATKGNYDEGFGKEKHTTKWEPQASTAPSTFVPVDKTDAPKEAKATTASSDVANKFKGIAASDKCEKCSKTVYFTEKIVVEDKEDKKLFHKSCFRCSHCQVVLSLGNYAAMNGIFYCKPHFKQLFATKGNYDEGFGKEKHTAKWIDRESEQGDEDRDKEERHRHEVEEQSRYERDERQRQETEERQRTEEAERRYEEEQRKLHEAEDERERHMAEEQRRHEREERQREENEERQRMEENERRRLEEVRLEEEEKERESEKEEEPHHKVHQEDEPVQVHDNDGGSRDDY